MTQQTWQAKQYQQNAAFVAELGVSLLDWLNAQPHESILDLGCGEGALAEKIAATGAQVTGVDASSSMVKAAVDKGLNAQIMDGQALTFNQDFDAVFSNAALHWMPDAMAVLQGVSRSLKPNGRFVAELGGAGNIEAIRNAMQQVFTENPEFGSFINPWFFPTETEYQALLEQAGFTVVKLELYQRPTPLESGIQAWLKVFAEYLTHHLNTQQTEYFLNQVERKLRPMLFSQEHGWVADYVRLRLIAIKASSQLKG